MKDRSPHLFKDSSDERTAFKNWLITKGYTADEIDRFTPVDFFQIPHEQMSDVLGRIAVLRVMYVLKNRIANIYNVRETTPFSYEDTHNYQDILFENADGKTCAIQVKAGEVAMREFLRMLQEMNGLADPKEVSEWLGDHRLIVLTGLRALRDIAYLFNQQMLFISERLSENKYVEDLMAKDFNGHKPSHYVPTSL